MEAFSGPKSRFSNPLRFLTLKNSGVQPPRGPVFKKRRLSGECGV